MSYSLLAEGVYALFLVRSAPRPVRACLAEVLAKVLGLAVGGAQLLPTMAFLANSNRGSFDPFFGEMAPWCLLQVIVPNLLSRHAPGWWREPFYFGAPAVMLLVWWLSAPRIAPVRRVRWDGSPEPSGRLGRAVPPEQLARVTRFAVVLGLLAAWLATGHYGGLYILQTKLPVVGMFRGPARYVTLAAFAGTALAGIGFGRLAARVRAGMRLPWRSLAVPWLAALAALAAGVAFQLSYPLTQPHGLDRRFASGALVMLAAAAALTLAVRGRRLGLYALVLLAGLDLWQHSLKNQEWRQELWSEAPTLAEFNAATDQPPVRHQGRIFSFTGRPTRLLLHGERLVNGYGGGIEPKKRLNYLTVPALRVAGAAWYREFWLRDTLQVPGLEPYGNFWYRVPDPLPRFRLVTRAVASDHPAADLLTIDVDTTALTERPLDLADEPAGTAHCTLEEPGHLCIEVDSPGRQLLVVSESHEPSWQVAVDGAPAEVLRVNGDFLGCVVGPGRHAVEFHFRPASVRWGLALSLAGLGLTILLGCMALLAPIYQRRFGNLTR
jgi:hypothetical protein